MLFEYVAANDFFHSQLVLHCSKFCHASPTIGAFADISVMVYVLGYIIMNVFWKGFTALRL